MDTYDHSSIEKKWQKRWEESQAFRAPDDSPKEKNYLLIEFPYPSGDGLHVGHVRSWTALDVVARKRRAEGKNVLYPVGWDAFGLPTENYAIKTGKDPRLVTRENTDNFRRQIKSVGLSFDWSREINTTDPAYYKWTQWIFLKFVEKGLAYKAKTLVNWCPKDKIVLANEEVVDGCCERCGTPVVKKEKEQWMIAITKYAQRLYDDLDQVDYIERAKVQQRNWIGPSQGAEIEFAVQGRDEKIKIFTTRPDTIFGATYMVLAPEHPFIKSAIDAGAITNALEVAEYIAVAKNKPEIERTAEGKEKTGVELKGVGAINPATKKEIPIYVADYVLASYGTGAIMAVPAHDERDYQFAKKFDLQIVQVVANTNFWHDPVMGRMKLADQTPFIGEGTLINSDRFDGLQTKEAKKKITESVGGKWVTTYKLRDWVFSRQRYWGEPIPMVYCESCKEKNQNGWVPVPEKDLPVMLPQVERYQPTDTGESPLANISEWVNTTCPTCGGPAERETDVMPNWAGSSWYYLRYADPQNAAAFAAKDKLDMWTPVDWYNGGMEHTVLHLLYSRFWHKFLYDLDLVPTLEPYMKRTSHGLILAEDGSKMSKSKGNTVSPDTIVETYGADSLRLYEMFLGPFDQPVAWSTSSIIGVRRFLERVWKMGETYASLHVSDRASGAHAQPPRDASAYAVEIEILLNQTIKKIGEDIENLKMNTAVSSLMTLLNKLEELGEVPKPIFEIFLKLLAPFAPHLAYELWERIGNAEQLGLEPWPQFDASKLVSAVAKLAVQINGKMRGFVKVPAEAPQEDAVAAVEGVPELNKWLNKAKEGKEAAPKIIYVKGKVISFVV